jgi:hypothetical protein
VCDDAHNCSLTGADKWVKDVLPSLMSGPDSTGQALSDGLCKCSWSESGAVASVGSTL